MARQKEISADIIKSNPLPRHVAIIMDGNGRWAQKRLLPRSMGHRAGMASLKEIVKAVDELTIPCLTVFAFSTENWKRPMTEVDFLMNLLVEFLQKELDELHQKNVQIRVMGDFTVLPGECQAEIENAIKKTRSNKGLVFNIAINYGSRLEIITTIKQFARKVMANEINIEDLNEKSFSSWLFSGDMPDPDLLIRTAGERRISNFMLWQIAYSEIVISETLWPDFSRNDLFMAVREYQGRDRRFGGLSRGQAE